eukprot:gene7555-16055_t
MSGQDLPGVAIYETGNSVKQYLSFHYETEEDVRKNSAAADVILASGGFNFAARCAEKVKAAYDSYAAAVGRSSFELSKWCDSVTGVDYSTAFIDACKTLQAAGTLPYSMQLEGEIFTQHEAKVGADTNPSRCTFEQGNACALRDDIGSFGCVLGANLICRLPNPLAFIDRVATLVAVGGVLVLTTPWTWLEDYTPRDKWKVNPDGSTTRSQDTLQTLLTARGFELVEEGSMPFIIRETFRKNQFTSSALTVWKRVE